MSKKEKNRNLHAFAAISESTSGMNRHSTIQRGLTKREWMIGQVLAGGYVKYSEDSKEWAKIITGLADAVLDELEKGEEK